MNGQLVIKETITGTYKSCGCHTIWGAKLQGDKQIYQGDAAGYAVIDPTTRKIVKSRNLTLGDKKDVECMYSEGERQHAIGGKAV